MMVLIGFSGSIGSLISEASEVDAGTEYLANRSVG
jgi:hypothetical protein